MTYTLMKKISLLLLMILFGMGLTTSIYASSDNPAPKAVAPVCSADIVNMAPCDVFVCMYYYDCDQVAQKVCLPVPAGGMVTIVTPGCCRGIIGISTQVLPGGATSAIIPPGGFDPGYMSGVPGPCFRLMLDYTSGMTYFIRP